MDLQTVVYLTRALVQLGITAEQYKATVNNPDMTDTELAEHLKGNSVKITELRNKTHNPT